MHPLRHNNHSVGVSLWHFEWPTKYRIPAFGNPEIRSTVENCIREAVKEHGIEIIEINVQPEHVHALAELPLTMAPSFAIQILKGGSAKLILGLHPELRQGDGLWSIGKFMRSVGNGDFDPVKEYVRNQDRHHATLAFMCPTKILQGVFLVG